MKKILVLMYGAVAYSIFLCTFLYAIGFTGNLLVPVTVSHAKTTSTLFAVFTDIVLLSIFALQHSVMARPAFKRWWAQFVPHSMERSTYVLLASLALIVLFWQWHSIDIIVWSVETTWLNVAVQCCFFLGWGIVLLSTFMINHFELFGLTQVYQHFKNIRPGTPEFKTNWLYKLVRHPIMLGFLIAFWSTPVMTVSHLVFTITTTLYILIAVKFLEEKDLERSIGRRYLVYKKKVPMLIPFTK